jgi:4-amino-4-deoxy-L-arabinose transferase-like glycosyltransferase
MRVGSLKGSRAVAGVVAVLLLVQFPALLARSPIMDESVYVVVARELLHGGRLYIDVVDRKPPLLYWVYAAILRTFGTGNWLALHAVGLLWVLATMGALHLVGLRLSGRSAGLVAALLYAVFQTFWDYSNLAFNGEVLMNLPIVVGLAIAFSPSRSRWRPELLVAGAMPALGFLLKQPGGIAALPLGIYVLLPGYRRARGLSMRQSLVHAALLSVGFAATLAAVALVLSRQGNLREAVYWSVLNHDVTYGPLTRVFWTLGSRMTLIFSACCAPLLLGVYWSLRDGELWGGREAERLALIVFLVVSAVGTAASGRFFDYYYIQLLPPLCLLAAPWFAVTWERHAGSLGAHATQAAVALCAIVFLVHNLSHVPPALGQTRLARYIRAHSSPEDRLFLWGGTTKFYLQADLRPASRYILFFPLTGFIFGSPWRHDPSHEDTRNRIVPGAWANLEHDFARHPPRYILDTEASYYPPKYPITDFPFLRDLVAQHYHLVFTAPQGRLYERR